MSFNYNVALERGETCAATSEKPATAAIFTAAIIAISLIESRDRVDLSGVGGCVGGQYRAHCWRENESGSIHCSAEQPSHRPAFSCTHCLPAGQLIAVTTQQSLPLAC